MTSQLHRTEVRYNTIKGWNGCVREMLEGVRKGTLEGVLKGVLEGMLLGYCWVCSCDGVGKSWV